MNEEEGYFSADARIKEQEMEENPTAKAVYEDILIWLNSSFDESRSDFKSVFTKFKSVFSSVLVFKNEKECLKCIQSIKHRQICMIVSGWIGRSIVEKVVNNLLIKDIYIICGDVQRHSKWAHGISKVTGIHENIDALCDAVLANLKKSTEPTISITYNGLDPMFLYTQLLKEAVIGIVDDHKVSLKDFNAYCQSLGSIGSYEVEFFIENYLLNTAIWWYTAETFIYSMVNRAFYEMDIKGIEVMAFFIRDLHRHIEQIYKEKHQLDRAIVQVYRGQSLSVEAFNKMTESIGELMSFNNFLSTSRNRDVSLKFAIRGSRQSKSVGILFQMTIDPDVCDRCNIPFASVSGVGFFDNEEEEILFTTHTIFRIKNIKPIEAHGAHRLFQVNITLAGNDDVQFKELTESIRNDVEEHTSDGWSRFGYILLKLNESKKALLIFQKLFDNASSDSEKKESAFYIGYAYWKLGDYSDAIKYYKLGIDIRKKTTSDDDISLTDSYENIGHVYKDMGDYEKALEFYQRALNIKNKSLPNNHLELSVAYLNIGNAYYSKGDYKQSLSFLEKSLDIRKKSLPDNHPDLAASYINIGNLHHHVGDYERALNYFIESSEIQKKSLPENHPDLAASYSNIGNVYEKMRQFNEALQYYENSLAIRKRALDSYHPDLAASYLNIGSVYHQCGQYDTALEYYEKSLEIKKKSLAENHPDLAAPYTNIGIIYKIKGDFEQAYENYKTSLKIKMISLPENHPDLAIPYYNIGLLLDQAGKYEAAFEHLVKAVEIFEKTLPETHPNVVKAKKDMKRLTEELESKKNKT